jgi:hypothetical protein
MFIRYETKLSINDWMNASLVNINGHTMFSMLLSLDKLYLLTDYLYNYDNFTFVAGERKIEFSYSNNIS